MALINSDGFSTRASDYSLYEDDNGILHILPHDVNEGMGAEEGPPGRGGPFGGGPDLDPLVGLNDESKPLRSKLLAVPALRAKYLAYVRDVADTWLDWNRLGPVAQKYHDVIAGDVKIDRRKLYTNEGFDSGMASVKKFADERRAFVLKAASHSAPVKPAA